MPTKAEQLTSSSSDSDYQSAVSDCIRQMVEEGRDQEQAAAICYSMAEKSGGRPYPKATKKPKGRRFTSEGVV